MNYRGLKQTQSVIEHLDRAFDVAKAEGRSLRSICNETMMLDPPERVHHPQLSQLLKQKGSRNFYLQQYFVFCSLLGRDPISMLLDTSDIEVAEEVAAIARLLVKLSKSKRQAIHALAKR